MRALLPLGLLALAACYTPRAIPGPVPYDGPTAAWDGAPLEASIWFDEYTGFASFDVNRPAHVAVFAMRPNGGIHMIYPSPGYGTRTAFTDGRHHVRTSMSGFHRTMGRSSHTSWSRTAGWGRSIMAGPTYILLVASEEPMEVEPLRYTPNRLWFNRVSLTSNPYVAMEALVSEIVPRPTSTRWTTAMHVVWPMDAWADPAPQRYIRVQCASGPIVTVPVQAWAAGYPICPEQLPPPTDVDSADAGVREAAPKRPQAPPAWIAADADDRKILDEVRQRRTARLDGARTEEFRPFWRRPPSEWVTRQRPGADARRTWQPSWERTRPGVRPMPRPARRPEARPRPTSRPEARPNPPARPVKPAAPARPKPKPSPPPKPSRPNGGGNGGNGGSADAGV